MNAAKAREGEPLSAPDLDPAFETLLDYLKRSRGLDLTGYKRPSLMRRIGQQMRTAGIEDYADYTSVLEADPDETRRLLNTIFINVTDFFRDPPAWESLRKEVVPQVLAGKLPAGPVRVWSAGCASGQEPYTLAIVLAEALGWGRSASASGSTRRTGTRRRWPTRVRAPTRRKK